jgi:hypothetical protein
LIKAYSSSSISRLRRTVTIWVFWKEEEKENSTSFLRRESFNRSAYTTYTSRRSLTGYLHPPSRMRRVKE